MGLIPNVAAMFKWVNSFFPGAKGGSQDFLQISRQSDGDILGWIDENGVPRGSLATGSGGGADIEVGGTPIAGTTANLNGTTPAAPNGSAPVAFQANSGNPTTNISASVAPFVASGASHAPGAVPDPGASAGTTRYLREDSTFAVPPGTGGGGVTTVTANAGSLAPAAIGQTTLVMAPTITVLSVACNGPLRLRLYSTMAALTADLNRPSTVPPTPGTQHGVICDLYLQTSGQYTLWNLSPSAPGANLDSPQTSNCYCSITNLSAITASPTAQITWI